MQGLSELLEGRSCFSPPRVLITTVQFTMSTFKVTRHYSEPIWKPPALLRVFSGLGVLPLDKTAPACYLPLLPRALVSHLLTVHCLTPIPFQCHPCVNPGLGEPCLRPTTRLKPSSVARCLTSCNIWLDF